MPYQYKHRKVGPLERDKLPLANPEYLLVILILQIWSKQEPLHMVHILFPHNTSNLERNNVYVLAPLNDQHHVVKLSGYWNLSAKAFELQCELYAVSH